jgi:hypothetical protein
VNAGAARARRRRRRTRRRERAPQVQKGASVRGSVRRGGGGVHRWVGLTAVAGQPHRVRGRFRNDASVAPQSLQQRIHRSAEVPFAGVVSVTVGEAVSVTRSSVVGIARPQGAKGHGGRMRDGARIVRGMTLDFFGDQRVAPDPRRFTRFAERGQIRAIPGT